MILWFFHPVIGRSVQGPQRAGMMPAARFRDECDR
jgi:hypothetical protein